MATTSDRRSWAVRRMSGTVDGIDLALLDPADPHERRLLIEAEHPKLRQALRDEVEEVVLEGQVMSPRLHITLHETVAERLWADHPPETWLTAQRLSALGYDRHEVLHMLMSVLNDELHRALQGTGPTPQSRDDMQAALAALPGSWEAQRGEAPTNRAERRAQQRIRHRRHR